MMRTVPIVKHFLGDRDDCPQPYASVITAKKLFHFAPSKIFISASLKLTSAHKLEG